MGRPPRIQYQNAHYHIYNRGAAQLPIVLDNQDRKTFFSILSEAIPKHQLELFAYCLMSNHYHLFLKIHEPTLHRSLQFLQTQYAKYFNRKHDRSGALFQGRYQSRLILEESYALTVIRYIHLNPVKAGMVQNPEDYLWSSYASYTGILPCWPWLNTAWLLNQFHPDPAKAQKIFTEFHLSVSDTDRHSS